MSALPVFQAVAVAETLAPSHIYSIAFALAFLSASSTSTTEDDDLDGGFGNERSIRRAYRKTERTQATNISMHIGGFRPGPFMHVDSDRGDKVVSCPRIRLVPPSYVFMFMFSFLLGLRMDDDGRTLIGQLNGYMLASFAIFPSQHRRPMTITDGNDLHTTEYIY